MRLWSVPGVPLELALFEDLCRSDSAAAALGEPVMHVETKMELTPKGNLLHKELV